MGNNSSSHKISSQDRAILDMKVQRDKLHQYQQKITKLTDRETEIAKECLARGQRSKALLALRQKKYQETLLAKTDSQLAQLQQLTSDVEFASVQKDVMYGLQQGTAVLKQIHAEMGGIERVERLLEENAEARAYEKEISDMLGGQISNADEDEVEDELMAMQKELGQAGTLPSAAISRPLPEVPSGDLDPKQRAKERARAREEAQRSMEPVAA